MTSPAELQAIRERDAHGPRPQDMLDDHIVECHVDRRDLLNLVAAQSDEVRRLKLALTTYGQHLDPCKRSRFAMMPMHPNRTYYSHELEAWRAEQVCTCGFDVAIGSQP